MVDVVHVVPALQPRRDGPFCSDNIDAICIRRRLLLRLVSIASSELMQLFRVTIIMVAVQLSVILGVDVMAAPASTCTSVTACMMRRMRPGTYPMYGHRIGRDVSHLDSSYVLHEIYVGL